MMADGEGLEPPSAFTPTSAFKAGLLPIRVTIQIGKVEAMAYLYSQ